MRFRRLAQAERYQIQALIASQQGMRSIARQLGRHASTVLREVRKVAPGQYNAARAELVTQQRKWPRYNRRRIIDGKLEKEVCTRLCCDWSPDQISGRFHVERKKKVVCYHTIYRYLERDKAQGGSLWKHLRILRRQRKDRKKPQWKKSPYPLQNRVMIDERPAIVEMRSRLGDYERDLVLGKVNRPSLLTIVDRRSRLLKLALITKKSARLVHENTVKLLRGEPVHTITNDNGMEFSDHLKTAEQLGAKVFFSRSYRSWERGTNENTNGLVRQYVPRKRDMGYLRPTEVKRIENLINNRPRKSLGYRTPREVHEQLKASGVAL